MSIIVFVFVLYYRILEHYNVRNNLIIELLFLPNHWQSRGRTVICILIIMDVLKYLYIKHIENENVINVMN